MIMCEFIEQNISQDFHKMEGSQKYRWENVILYTRHCRETDLQIIETQITTPVIGTFCLCFDSVKVKDNVDFYDWLKNVFFVEYERLLPKIIKKIQNKQQ